MEKEPLIFDKLTKYVLSNIREGLLVVSSKGEILFANGSASIITGIPRKKLLGKKILAVLPLDKVLKRNKEDLFLSFANLEGSYSLKEKSFYLKSFILDGRGVIILRDITSEKKDEKELKKESRIIKLQQKIAQAVNESETAEKAMKRSIELVCSFAGLPVGHLYFVSKHYQSLIPTGIWYFSEKSKYKEFQEETENLWLKKGEGLSGKVWEEGKPIWLDDLSKSKFFARKNSAKKAGLKVGFAFPIMIKNEVTSVMEFYGKHLIHKDDEILETLKYVGTQIGRTIERQRRESQRIEYIQQEALRVEAEIQKRRSQFLSEVTTSLSSSLDYFSTLEALAKMSVPQLGDWCRIQVLEKGKLKTAVIYHRDPLKVKLARTFHKIYERNPSDEDPTWEVLNTGKSAFIEELTQSLIANIKNRVQRNLLQKLGLRSCILVPLVSRNGTFGVITFVTSESNRVFTADDLALAEELAQRASVAIENARLFQEAKSEIIARKQLENELRESVQSVKRSENLLLAIINTSTASIFLKDLKGKYLLVNKVKAKSLGLTPEKVIGKKDTDLNPPQIAKELRGHDRKVFLSRSSLQFEETFLTDSGTKTFLTTKFPLVDEQGNIYAIGGIGNDISERVESEKRKDQFIGLASHELKTPVTSMKVFVQILKRRIEERKDKELEAFLKKLDYQLDKLTELITDLLDLSRIQSNQLPYRIRTFNLNDLAEETIENMMGISPDYKFDIESKEKINVKADRERIGQVLINFLTNAIKYSPKNKRVIVKIKKKEDSVRVEVIDFGFGISKENQKRVFERFFQVEEASERTFPGLGVGLYISKIIIERHNGVIGVKSEKGKGSIFFFELPLKQ